MNSLKIYNTLSREKEEFIPLNKNSVGMYVCGPTVYDEPHIGNARPLIIFDLVYRILIKNFGKNKVNYVRNITDIDDKIIQRANELKIDIRELTKNVTEIFLSDCKYLNCLIPNNQPKATENIKGMIQMIENLLAKKFAYIKDGNVYFNVNKFKDYGKLSNKNPKDLISGSRVEISELKNNPLDFVLWKPSKDKEPFWESPWGNGRPGWHIECSAIALHYLGPDKADEFAIDIQGGGSDLIFPHHDMSAAQGLVATGQKFAQFFVHAGMIGLDGTKMSKSLGNLIFVSRLINEGIEPMAIRLALLGHHYRSDHMWGSSEIADASAFLQRIRLNLARMEVAPTESVIADLVAALSNDLDTVRALEAISAWCTATEDGATGGSAGQLSRVLDDLLGLAL